MEESLNKTFTVAESPGQQVSPMDNKFALQSATGLLLLSRNEIVYFMYSDKLRSWDLYLANGSRHRLRTCITSKSIMNIGGTLIQLSRDYIVNTDFLAVIEDSTHSCILHPPFDDLKIIISRRRFNELKESFVVL